MALDTKEYTNQGTSGKSFLCDGFCIACPKKLECPFSKVESKRGNKYNDSDELNRRALSVDAFSSRFKGYNSGEGYGFSNPNIKYSGQRGEYGNSPGFNYGESSSSTGFHGSYSGKDDYSKMTPRGGKSNYCSGSSCGKK